MTFIKVLYHEFVEEAEKYLFVFEREGTPFELELEEELGTFLASCLQESTPPVLAPPPEPPKKSAMELARERANAALKAFDDAYVEPLRPKTNTRPLRAERKEYQAEPEAELLRDLIGEDLEKQRSLVGDVGPDGNSVTDDQIRDYAKKIQGGSQKEKNQVFSFLVRQADVGTLYRFAPHLPTEVRLQVCENRARNADERGVIPQDLLPFLYNRVDRLYAREGKAIGYTEGDADPLNFNS